MCVLKMVSSIIGVLIVGTAAQMAYAQPATPPSKPLSSERLMMPLFPNGWQTASTVRGNVEVIDYVPDGQTGNAWRDRITLEVYHDLNSLPLDVLHRRAQSSMRDQCDNIIAGRFQSGLNNGFPSAFWTFGCTRNKDSGMGETRYTKAIQGENRVYVLTRAWRTPAFDNTGPDISKREIEDAVAFLTTTVACADGDPQHPCPPGR